MIDKIRVIEAQDRIMDNILIIGIREIKGYTTKKNLKEQFERLS